MGHKPSSCLVLHKVGHLLLIMPGVRFTLEVVESLVCLIHIMYSEMLTVTLYLAATLEPVSIFFKA